MAEAAADLDRVASVVKRLTDLGLTPVLIGGMALVLLGSRRVTRDFDFVIGDPTDRLQSVIDVLYDRGFELASAVNDAGEVIATIASRKVADIRLRLDAPSSAYFINPRTRLRIDLLFDFPLPAADLAEHATQMKVRGHRFRVASEADLLRLKKIAQAKRSFAGDAQDIAFLDARRNRRS